MQINANISNLNFKARLVNDRLKDKAGIEKAFREAAPRILEENNSSKVNQAIQDFRIFVSGIGGHKDVVIINPEDSYITVEHRVNGLKEISMSQKVRVFEENTLLRRLKAVIRFLDAENHNAT